MEAIEISRRLATAWRGNDGGREIRRRAVLLEKSSIFGKQSTRALRQLACLAEHVRFEEGEAVFHQGDEPDGLYVIDEGFCSVEVEGLGTLATLSGEGTTFGELALFLDDVRSATVRAQSEARLLRMDKEAAMSILRESWGDRDQMEYRADQLGKMALFSSLRRAELLVLAAHMERTVIRRPDVKVVTEDQQGSEMYLVEQGNPMVTIKGVGRVGELEQGAIFGELAILQSPYHYRTATVTTVDVETVLWSLSQEDVYRLIPYQRRAETLEKCKHSYDERAKIRTSDRIVKEIDKFWGVVTAYSRSLRESKQDSKKSHHPDFWRALKRNVGRGQIEKPAYVELHLRISKVLAPGPKFSVKEALEVTNHDWCEDITAFAGETTSSVYIEKVKEQLVRQVEKVVSQTGWHTLFSRYDDDGGGTLSFLEFQQAVRKDMNIPTRDMVLLRDYEQKQAAAKLAAVNSLASAAGTAIFAFQGLASKAAHRRNEQSSIDPILMRDTMEDKELKRLFKAADVDGGGDISATEFAAFMAEPEGKDNDKKVLQAAATKRVLMLGWEALFAKVDFDGSGEMEFDEFVAVTRGECELDEESVSDDNLRHLFDAIDKDGGGSIDIKEMMEFLSYKPFERDMDYDSFAESLFQLASSWVDNKDISQLWDAGRDKEDMYVRFFQFLWYRITDDVKMLPLDQVKIASNAEGGLNFEQQSARELAQKKKERPPKLKTMATKLMHVRSMKRSDSEVFRNTWEMRAAHVEERRQAVLATRAQAAHKKLLRAEQVQMRVAAAERLAAKQQNPSGVYLTELCRHDNAFDTVVAAVGSSGSIDSPYELEAATMMPGGNVFGGICHGHGHGSRTRAVFSRVYVHPIRVFDPDAKSKARIRLQKKRAADAAEKRMKKEQAAADAGHAGRSITERQALHGIPLDPEPESQTDLEVDTSRKAAYEAYSRMLDDTALWNVPEWLPAQRMAAAGIATPYRNCGSHSSWRDVPMRPGAGGAGNRWVADLAGMQSGSDRTCRLELAVDVSPRGTPCSPVSQQRFPSRNQLLKPQTPMRKDTEIVAAETTMPPTATSTQAKQWPGDTSVGVLQLEHRVKSVGPAGFRSPRVVHDIPTTSRLANEARPYSPRNGLQRSGTMHPAWKEELGDTGAPAPAFMHGKSY